jgi:hypothetical protein
MTDTTFIYALNDPRTGECRYVGKSDTPEKRFVLHLITAARMRTHKDKWVSSLKAGGLRPTLEVLDEVPHCQWEFWEREYIRVFRAIGMRLTNHTEGGEGNNMRGRTHSEETKKRIGQAQLGRKRSPETRRKQSVSASGKVRSAEHCKNISLAKKGCRGPNLGKKFSPETCAKISASKKAANAAKKGLS